MGSGVAEILLTNESSSCAVCASLHLLALGESIIEPADSSEGKSRLCTCAKQKKKLPDNISHLFVKTFGRGILAYRSNYVSYIHKNCTTAHADSNISTYQLDMPVYLWLVLIR